MRKSSSRRIIRRSRSVVLRSKFKFERRKKVKKFIKYTLILGIGGALLWSSWKSVYGFLTNFEGFNIKDIEIIGTQNIAKSEVIALLPFKVGDNIFKIYLSDTEKNFKELKPELKSIKITPHWQKVTIRINERTPIACTFINGQKLGVDLENAVFPLRGKLINQFLPEIITQNSSERRKLLEFINYFSMEGPDILARIIRLYPEPINSIVFELKDSFRVYWGAIEKDKIKKKLGYMNQVLKDAGSRFQGLEYIDLSYFDDGRILVKPIIFNRHVEPKR